MKKIISMGVSLVAVVLFSSIVTAAPLTPAMCKEKVTKAVALMNAEGPACYATLADPNGEFRFGDGEGYVWIHELETTVMAFHPIKEALVGRSLVDLKDSTGKYFFLSFNEMVEDNGSGWVMYQWPKPGESTTSQKVSFVAQATFDGIDYVVGSGVYDATEATIKAEFPDDAVDAE